MLVLDAHNSDRNSDIVKTSFKFLFLGTFRNIDKRGFGE
jgi:hypothetical protein